jgi:probable HAF family extracellular repeat protein
MRTSIQGVIVAVAFLGMGLAAPAYAQISLIPYRVKSATAIDVQMATVKESEALDISDDGDIVGWAINSAGIRRAFLSISGFMFDIGPVNPDFPSTATGINNVGEVVGHFSDEELLKPFYWHVSSGPVEMSHLLFPGKGWDDKFVLYPHAINDHGRIVGFAEGIQYGTNPAPLDGCHENLSVQWTDRSANPHRLFCNDDIWINRGATDVNNSGEIVGYSQGFDYEGYVWSGGNRIDVPPLTGGHGLMIFGINESGKVVGSDGGYHAIFWDRIAAHSRDLGYLPSGDRAEAYEINDSNFIGGFSNTLLIAPTAVAKVDRAFIWHADFGMFGLPVPSNFSSTANCRANSINNRVSASGLVQLAGYCTKNGKDRAVRWDVIVTRELEVGPVRP